MFRSALCWLAILGGLLGAPAFAATVLYVYDELGRLVAEIDPAAETTTYSYDGAGNLLAVSRASSSQFRLIAFAPTRGKPGEVVTVHGSGFGATPAQNTVAFNGTPAAVTAATPNTLTVTVPAGVATGPISVISPTGSGVTAQPFILAVPSTIVSVNPDSVTRGATTRIQISGSQLDTARAISFNQAGLWARPIPGTSSTLLDVDLTVGGLVPVGSYSFTVTNDAGTSDSGSVTLNVTTDLVGSAFSTTRIFSVYLPAAVPGAPAGDSMSSSSAFSVHLRVPDPGGSAADSMTVSQPFSVSKP